jgi:hypothetical protein
VYKSRFEPLFHLLGPWVVDGSFVGSKGIQGALEELWNSGEGAAEEPAILQRHAQGCVEPSRGLEDPILPLSVPSGVQLAPTSPKLGEGVFYELRMCYVLGSSASCSGALQGKEGDVVLLLPALPYEGVEIS